ncbi:MAG: hypothetical protein ACETVZ_00815 [Phycisphaerae bacterium]
MNTFWLKIAGVAVIIVVVVVLIGVFSSNPPVPQVPSEPPAKTIYEQWERDDERLRAEPEPIVPPKISPSAQPRQPQFKKLSMEEEIEAQRKWEWVVNQRKMGRLPGMGYKQMVDTCREIIQRWPESKYAFLAKRALADLPERYHTMYNITKEEMDVSNFYK